jgi:mRNA interferase HigB
MRINKATAVRSLASRNPNAAQALNRWLELAGAARWTHLTDLRQTFRSADEVKVGSGRTVVVFHIAGNKYRLITAIHYNLQRLYVVRLLTHAEYSKDRWKDEL